MDRLGLHQQSLRPPPQFGVIWITGLSGAGKTTIANALQRHLATNHPTVLLDGDALRHALGATQSYGPEDRRNLAYTYARLAQYIAGQGFTVVCATISMFHDVRTWNRENNPRYFEIYLRVPEEELKRRDPKGLYAGARSGRMVAFEGGFEEPASADLVIDNHGLMSAEETTALILDALSQHAASQP
jgi:adenylylsulfate kinase